MSQTESKPELRIGPATMRKKPTDKYSTVAVTENDIKKTLFLETFELYGTKWNRFEDKRGWEWVQQKKD